MKYKIIDMITSDVCFEAYGKDERELFVNASLALFSIVCDIKKIKNAKEMTIEAEADNKEDLLINYLSALIASVDIDGMFYSRFTVLELDGKHVKMLCRGGDADRELGRTLVKAVTYHQYRFEKTKKGFMARVCFDI